MTKKLKKTKSQEVLLKIDRPTAEEIKRMSDETQMPMQDITRWLVWLGRKSFGRKLRIVEGDRVLELSMEEYNKLVEELDKN